MRLDDVHGQLDIDNFGDYRNEDIHVGIGAGGV